ncbi:MAG TPA: hypothetical protein VGJ26_09245 [Pirellulales bacterium]|jgi:hypothetical protein
MVRRIKRTTSLLAATAYLLAIVFSNLFHFHQHALGDAGPVHICEGASGHAHPNHAGHEGADHCASLDDCDDDQSHEHDGSPTSDDDCSVCRFLGRPIQGVRPFEIAEVSGQVTTLPAMRAPAVLPVSLVITQARAPPYATPSI